MRNRHNKARVQGGRIDSTGRFVRPQRVSCRARLRAYRKHLAMMIETGVESALRELYDEEELDGRTGISPEGAAQDSGAEPLQA